MFIFFNRTAGSEFKIHKNISEKKIFAASKHENEINVCAGKTAYKSHINRRVHFKN